MPVVRKRVVEVTAEIDKHQCNVCSKIEEENIEGARRGNFHLLELSGGYDSLYPGDLSSVEFVVCDDCINTYVSTFKLPVTRRGVDYRCGHVTDVDPTLPIEDPESPEGKAIALLRQAHEQGRLAFLGSQAEPLEARIAAYLHCPHTRGALRLAWRWGFSDAAKDQKDRELVEKIRKVFFKEWEEASNHDLKGIPVEEHYEDPPTTGFCYCGLPWPCTGEEIEFSEKELADAKKKLGMSVLEEAFEEALAAEEVDDQEDDSEEASSFSEEKSYEGVIVEDSLLIYWALARDTLVWTTLPWKLPIEEKLDRDIDFCEEAIQEAGGVYWKTWAKRVVKVPEGILVLNNSETGHDDTWMLLDPNKCVGLYHSKLPGDVQTPDPVPLPVPDPISSSSLRNVWHVMMKERCKDCKGLGKIILFEPFEEPHKDCEACGGRGRHGLRAEIRVGTIVMASFDGKTPDELAEDIVRQGTVLDPLLSLWLGGEIERVWRGKA